MSKISGITLNSGGMNNVVLPHLLKDGESEEVRNLYLSKDGSLQDINRPEILLDLSNTFFANAIRIDQWKPSRVPIDCIDNFVYIVYYQNGTVAMVYRGIEDTVMYYVYVVALCTNPSQRLAVLMSITPNDVNGSGSGTTPTNLSSYLSRRYFNGADVVITAPQSGGTVGEHTFEFYRWLDALGEPISVADRELSLEISGNIYVAAEYVATPYIRIEYPEGTPISDLGEFYSHAGGQSEVKSYYVGGIGLSAPLIIYPSESFDISLDGETWEEAATGGNITISASAANEAMTRIYVRYVPRSEE